MASDGSLVFDTQIDDSGFKKGAQKLKDAAGTVISGTGAALSAVSAGLLAIGKSAAEVGTVYEDSMNKVASIADTSVKSIAEISAEVKKLSVDTGTSAAALNDAVYQAISAGVDTAHAVDFVATATKAAKGGFTDAETAVNGLTNVLNTYKKSASEADDVANKFLITQNKGKTSFGELASYIGQVAPTAQSVNVSIEELLSSVASLTANGITTSSAMAGMKAALSNIISPTSEAAKTAEQLGIDFSAAALQSKGWVAFLDEIKEAAHGDTAVMSSLFGSVEALNTMLILTGNGADLLNDTLAEMETNTTALDDAYNTMTDSFTTETAKLKAAAEVLGSSIYDSISDPLRELVSVGNGYIRQLTDAFTNGGLDAISREIGNVMADALNVVGGYAPDVMRAASDLIIAFMDGVEQNSDSVIETSAQIIDIMLDTISKTLPRFSYTAVEILAKLTSEILSRLDEVTQTAADIIEALAQGLFDYLPKLVPQAVNAVLTVVETIIDNADMLTEAALNIIIALADGLASEETIKNLTDEAPVIIRKLIYALEQVLSNVFDFGIEIGYEIIRGLVNFDFEGQINSLNQRLFSLGEAMHLSIIEGYNSVGQNTVWVGEVENEQLSAYGDKTKDELENQRAEIERQKKRLEDAWNDYKNSGYSSIDEYLKYNLRSENGVALNTLREEAERQNINIADMFNDKIAAMNKAEKEIIDAISTGNYMGGDNWKNPFDYDATVKRNEAYAANFKAKAEVISEAADEITESADTAAESLGELNDTDVETDELYDEFSRFYANLKLLYAHGDIDDDEYKKRLSEKLNSDSRYYSEKYTSFWSEIKEASAGTTDELYDEFTAFYANLKLLLAHGDIGDEEFKKRLSDKLNSDGRYFSEKYTSFWNEIKDTETAGAEDVKETMRREWNEISHLNGLGIDDDETTQKKRLGFIKKYCPEYSDEYYEYYKSVYDYQQEYEKKSLESTKQTLTEQANTVSEKLSGISAEYKSKFSEIQRDISSYKNSLLAVGKTFSVTEETDENGNTTRTVTVNNVAERLQKMRDYHKNLLELKNKGASASLISEILRMGEENGAYLAEQLVNDSTFEEFSKLYDQLDAEAQKMAEEFYQPEITALNQSTAAQIRDAFGTLPEDLKEIGGEALAQFYAGFISAALNGNTDLSDVIGSMTDSFKSGFSESIENMTLGSDVTAQLSGQDYYDTGAAAAQSWSAGFSDNIAVNSAEFTTEMSFSGNNPQRSAHPEYEKIILNADINITTNLDGEKIAENTAEYQKEFRRRSDSYE